MLRLGKSLGKHFLRFSARLVKDTIQKSVMKSLYQGKPQGKLIFLEQPQNPCLDLILSKEWSNLETGFTFSDC